MPKEDNTIAQLNAKIEYHEAQAKKYKDVLLVLKELDSEPVARTTQSVPKKNNETFEDVILNILSTETELGSRALMEKYNHLTKKSVDLPQFSSRLGLLVKKESLKKITDKNKPMSERYLYRKK